MNMIKYESIYFYYSILRLKRLISIFTIDFIYLNRSNLKNYIIFIDKLNNYNLVYILK